MAEYLPLIQIIVASLVIILILLQKRGTALGSAFGGESGSFYGTRRDVEKKIFWGSIGLTILFIVLAVLNLVLSP